MKERFTIPEVINTIPVNGRDYCFTVKSSRVKIKLTIKAKTVFNPCETSYFYWDFGDPFSTEDNPNIIAVKDPTQPVEHTYWFEGKYTIHFVEVRESGRIIERTIPILVYRNLDGKYDVKIKLPKN